MLNGEKWLPTQHDIPVPAFHSAFSIPTSAFSSMPILRQTQLPTTTQAFSLADVEDVAKRVLLKAKLQAERLIAAAMLEAEKLKEEARQEGSREGFEHGHAEGVRHGTQAGEDKAFATHSAELATLAETFKAMTAEFDSGRRNVESEMLREVIALAVAIARRVTKRQGLVEPAVLEANLAEAMKLTVGASDLRVAVHPAQREYLELCLPRLSVQWPALKHVELVDDPSLSPGGCHVFTRAGGIDADLESQLDRVITAMLPDDQTRNGAA
jgi:flagellar assembly protein FliH